MPALEINQFTLGDLQTNCYLVWDPQTLEAIIIDPADEGGYLSEQILERQLKLTGIVLTHGHFDHVLGLLELKLNFSAPISMHSADQFLLKQAAKSALHWLKRAVDPVPLADSFLKEGDLVVIGHSSLKVMATPGHTPGSICLFNDEIIFTGDTLFKNGIGRTDFKYASPLQLNESLHRLLELPSSLTVYPGHGESTTIAEARESLSDFGANF